MLTFYAKKLEALSHLLATTMASSNTGQNVGMIDTLKAAVPIAMGTAEPAEVRAQRTEPAAARLPKDGRRCNDRGNADSGESARQSNGALNSVVTGSASSYSATGAIPFSSAAQDSDTERSAASAGQRLSTN